jgi:tyrosine-protein kinase
LSVEGTQYLRLLRRNWLIFVAAIFIGVGGGYLAYRHAPPQYRSTVVFYVQSVPKSSSPADVYQAELVSQARAQTYRLLPSSENVAQQVSSLPGVDVSAGEVQSGISATAPAGNALVQVTVTGDDQRRATAIALGLERVLPADVERLQSSAGQPVTTRLHVFAGPASMAGQVGPSRSLYLGLGLLAGLVLGLLASVLRERYDRRVRDDGDVRAVVGGTTVGFSLLTARRDSESQRRLLDTLSAPVMAAVANTRPIAVVPLGRADKAALHIMQFAAGVAQRGEYVTVLDCDALEHRVSEAADMSNIPGLTDILNGNGTVGSSVRRFQQSGLKLVPAGTDQSRYPIRAGEPRMAEVLAASRRYGDLVLLATPPLLSGSVVVWPANACIDVILFVERRRITKDSLRAAAQVLEAVNARLVGVVLFYQRLTASNR